MKTIQALPLNVYKRIFHTEIEGSVNGARKLQRMYGLGPRVTHYVQHLVMKAKDDPPDPYACRLCASTSLFLS